MLPDCERALSGGEPEHSYTLNMTFYFSSMMMMISSDGAFPVPDTLDTTHEGLSAALIGRIRHVWDEQTD